MQIFRILKNHDAYKKVLPNLLKYYKINRKLLVMKYILLRFIMFVSCCFFFFLLLFKFISLFNCYNNKQCKHFVIFSTIVNISNFSQILTAYILSDNQQPDGVAVSAYSSTTGRQLEQELEDLTSSSRRSTLRRHYTVNSFN